MKDEEEEEASHSVRPCGQYPVRVVSSLPVIKCSEYTNNEL
jgi:hypothetical protein